MIHKILKGNLGQRVRRLREEKGWSQLELAARLPGVHQQSIDQLERGQVKRPRFLPELAQALNTSVHWLLTGEDVKTARPRKNDPGLDADLLRDVFIAVEHVLAERGRKTPLEQKIKLICALYDLTRTEEHVTTAGLERAANNIVSYDNYLQKAAKN